MKGAAAQRDAGACRDLRVPSAPAEDCRCLCGSLVARVSRDGVELKCRRCKRTLLVPFPELPLDRRPDRPVQRIRASGSG